jgi:hypothetical protein
MIDAPSTTFFNIEIPCFSTKLVVPECCSSLSLVPVLTSHLTYAFNFNTDGTRPVY